jgi:hypothetical protein
MRRARWMTAAVLAWTLGVGASVRAQTPPEGWIVLSIDEYRDLRQRALGGGRGRGASPDAVLSRVDYDLALDGATVSGRVELTVDVLSDGWVRLPIPSGLIVSSARVDGRTVAIADGPPPSLLLSRPGRSVVVLGVVMPVVSTAGTESVGLPAAPVSITRVALMLPRSGVDLSLTGGFISDHVDAGGESRWTLFGRPGDAMQLSWKRRVDDRRALLPLRTRGHIVQVVSFGEELGRLSASVRADVVEGSLQEVVLAVPDGVAINEVTGATLATWAVTQDRLRVRLLEPVTTSASFVVTAETRVARDGALTVPLFRMPSAERETGGVAVDILGAGEIIERRPTGLEPADPSELGDPVTAQPSASVLAFRLRPLAGTSPRALRITVVRYTPQAVLSPTSKTRATKFSRLASVFWSKRSTRFATTAGASSRSPCPTGRRRGVPSSTDSRFDRAWRTAPESSCRLGRARAVIPRQRPS